MLWGFISILIFYDSNEVRGLIEWNEVIKTYNFIIYTIFTIPSRVKIFLFNLNGAGNDLSIYTSQFAFIFNENFASNFVFLINDAMLQKRKLCQSVNTKREHMHMQPIYIWVWVCVLYFQCSLKITNHNFLFQCSFLKEVLQKCCLIFSEGQLKVCLWLGQVREHCLEPCYSHH